MLFSGFSEQGLLSSCSGFVYHGAQAWGTQTSVVSTYGLSSYGSCALECAGFSGRQAHQFASWALERKLSSCGDGLSCFTVCGILLDQELNPCPLHWQADSYPLYH